MCPVELWERCHHALSDTDPISYNGRVTRIIGLTIESRGPGVSVGETCYLYPKGSNKPIMAEVVGFRDDRVLLMPFGEMLGVAPGCEVVSTGRPFMVGVGRGLLGRVLDGLGRPIDGYPPPAVERWYPTDSPPPSPMERRRITEPLAVGVRAIDALLTCGKGQRIGIFSGSGVGKSTLLGMIARNTSADVNVIALVGERGREVRDFLEKDLGEDGLKRSVVVAATSDRPALLRIKAAFVATAIAEYFRDCGMDVTLMMDSVTRFAMALREVGLAVGEPPATRGYTPSVFAALPRLLERSGSSSRGTITGFYTVLVEGDDTNEPITDAVRSILDGHVMLSRDLASKNHYPAIDVLSSVSRLMVDVADEQQLVAAGRVREMLATYREAEDLISVGAYQHGSNPKIDKAIAMIDRINEFLKQGIYERVEFHETISTLISLAAG